MALGWAIERVRLESGRHGDYPGSPRFTVVHCRDVAVLFLDTRPVGAIPFHHNLLVADDRASFFTLPD